MESQVSIIKEINVNNNVVKVGDDHIIYVTAVGEVDDQFATKYRDTFYEVLDFFSEDRKAYFLINLDKIGKQSPEARKLWNSITADKRVKAAAVFGAKLISKVILNFVVSLSSRQNMKFFNNEKEAKQWLMKIKASE